MNVIHVKAGVAVARCFPAFFATSVCAWCGGCVCEEWWEADCRNSTWTAGRKLRKSQSPAKAVCHCPVAAHRWLNARLQLLQCVSNGISGVLRKAVDMYSAEHVSKWQLLSWLDFDIEIATMVEKCFLYPMMVHCHKWEVRKRCNIITLLMHWNYVIAVLKSMALHKTALTPMCQQWSHLGIVQSRQNRCSVQHNLTS